MCIIPKGLTIASYFTELWHYLLSYGVGQGAVLGVFLSSSVIVLVWNNFILVAMFMWQGYRVLWYLSLSVWTDLSSLLAANAINIDVN